MEQQQASQAQPALPVTTSQKGISDSALFKFLPRPGHLHFPVLVAMNLRNKGNLLDGFSYQVQESFFPLEIRFWLLDELGRPPIW